jgi:hypothetical protein
VDSAVSGTAFAGAARVNLTGRVNVFRPDRASSPSMDGDLHASSRRMTSVIEAGRSAGFLAIIATD